MQDLSRNDVARTRADDAKAAGTPVAIPETPYQPRTRREARELALAAPTADTAEPATASAPLTRREARAREQAAQQTAQSAEAPANAQAPLIEVAAASEPIPARPAAQSPASEPAAPFIAAQPAAEPQTARPEFSGAPRAPRTDWSANSSARPARKPKAASAAKPSRVSAFVRPRTAAAASAASLGLVASLLFAIPANAAEPGAQGTSIPSLRDSHGQTAAQILQVANDASIPQATRDSYVATALSTIAAEEAAQNAATATQVVANTPGATGGDNPTTPEQIQTAINDALQVGGKRQQIVETALSYLGDPYEFGGTSHSGIDCSGLVMAAYAPVGITFSTHLVGAEDAAGTTIPASEAQPGDLLVFNDDDHIGIYLGSGLVIHAPDVGRPVEIEAAWDSSLAHYVRVLPN